jgi:agmatine deiminase
MQKRASSFIERAGADLSKVRFHGFEYADVWIRDYGPTFLIRKNQPRLAMVHWIFNAWGGKYEELMGDTRGPDQMFPGSRVKKFKPGIVMEGGSIEVNGQGTVLTTEQCLLNKNRNPKLSRAQIEKALKDNLGVKNIVWLGEGIVGDDTDGHIDDIARFVGPRKVVCAVEENFNDANYEPLKECFEKLSKAKDQDGKELEVVRLPMPEPVCREDGSRLPASYANFYIGNGVVLAPVFGCAQDDAALKVLEKCFTGRRIAPIPCREWVAGLGTIHCGSQQQPVAK